MVKKVNDVIWLKNKDGYIDPSNENIFKVKELLGETGRGFCLAKFTQVTMHLGTGMTHSCHHPSPHKIPLEEIEANPAALFNTSVLKKARREMFEGNRPSECDYCWRIEDNDGYSDRFFKSLEPWALNDHDRIAELHPDENIYPSYLEVDFSNVCNFACTYCGPEYSSKWVENLKQHGPIKLLDNSKHVQWSHGWQDLDSLAYKNSEVNPYVDAFWKWFPEAYKHLKVYRITGGEPLLSKETFRSMDWFIENPNPELEFSINSNLGAPDKLWDQFIEKIKILTQNKCVKRFTVFTSVDGWGERAEYARPGLNFELFKKRYEQLLEIGNIRATIMCTYNIFSVTSMKELLEWQSYLKSTYNPDMAMIDLENQFGYKLAEGKYTQNERKARCQNHHGLVGIDVPYLRSPGFLDAHYVDKDLIQDYMIPSFNYMVRYASGNVNGMGLHQGFEEYEIEKFKRILIEAMNFNKIHDEDNEVVLIHRARFYDFVNEIDRRYDRSFTKTFPEMIYFYEKCKQAKEKILSQ